MSSISNKKVSSTNKPSDFLSKLKTMREMLRCLFNKFITTYWKFITTYWKFYTK